MTAREVMHSSAAVDWYTPAYLMGAVRELLGAIDLDPASCAAANETVGAARYFTEIDDGLAQRWHGRLFLNPPYGTGRPRAAVMSS